MVNFIVFMDGERQEEIDTFYKVGYLTDHSACQMQREFYKGYPKSHHPLTYFKEQEFLYQCPSEMSQVYLSYPSYHVKYKQPLVLPVSLGRTSGMPDLPERSLAATFNPAACQVYKR